MSIVINVGIDGTTREAAMAVILPLFTRCCVEFCTAPTGEDTLVVKGYLVGQPTDYTRHHNMLWNAAGLLNQDCIAFRWPDGSGTLIGPNAGKWGQFDPDKFVYPAWMAAIDE